VWYSDQELVDNMGVKIPPTLNISVDGERVVLHLNKGARCGLVSECPDLAYEQVSAYKINLGKYDFLFFNQVDINVFRDFLPGLLTGATEIHATPFGKLRVYISSDTAYAIAGSEPSDFVRKVLAKVYPSNPKSVAYLSRKQPNSIDCLTKESTSVFL